jgi:mRNA-degrading endonuclease RelE of RelBE toxin-antitoxin system
MELVYSPAFLKAYAKLSAELREHVDKQLHLLADNPHHPSLRTHKRRGEGEVWQARTTRNYRLFFEMDGGAIHLLTLGPHEK